MLLTRFTPTPKPNCFSVTTTRPVAEVQMLRPKGHAITVLKGRRLKPDERRSIAAFSENW